MGIKPPPRAAVCVPAAAAWGCWLCPEYWPPGADDRAFAERNAHCLGASGAVGAPGVVVTAAPRGRQLADACPAERPAGSVYQTGQPARLGCRDSVWHAGPGAVRAAVRVRRATHARAVLADQRQLLVPLARHMRQAYRWSGSVAEAATRSRCTMACQSSESSRLWRTL